MSFRNLAVASLLGVLLAPTAFSQPQYEWKSLTLRGRDFVGNYAGGSFVTRADGKILVTYRIEHQAMLSVVASEAALFAKSNAGAANEHAFYKYYSLTDESQSILQKLSSGHILLYIVEPGVLGSAAKPGKIDVYESANGLGTDFAKISTIYSHTLPPLYLFGTLNLGKPIQVGSRILIPAALPMQDVSSRPDIVYTGRLYCVISTNGGHSWKFSQIAPDGDYRDTERGFGVAGNQLLVLDQSYYGRGTTTLYSHPLSSLTGTARVAADLPQWAAHQPYRQKHITDMEHSHLFLGGDGYTYLLRDDAFKNGGSTQYYIYRRSTSAAIDMAGQTPYSIGAVGSGATWQGPLNTKVLGDDGYETLSVTPGGAIALYGTSWYAGGSIADLYVGRQ